MCSDSAVFSCFLYLWLLCDGLLAPGSIMEYLEQHYWGMNEGMSAKPVWHILLLKGFFGDVAETMLG